MPGKLSKSDLEILRSVINNLDSNPDESHDASMLGKLIASERKNLPELFSERKCTPGEILFQENEIGQSMFIILAGNVAVIKGEFPAPVILGRRGCGETIGEMALLEGESRSASIIALDDLHLLEIQRDNFLELLRVSSSFSYGIMRLLSARLRETSAAVQRETLDKIRDPLTGLYNRRFMEESLEQEIQRAEREKYPVSLVMLDIDHFKFVNDEFGHQAGDQILRALSDQVRIHVRRGDVACRYGGEEFLIILPNTSIEVACRRAEELRQAFETLKVEHNHVSIQRTISIGVACYPNHGDDLEKIITAADAALYTAKANGRNQVCASPS
jgi:diguanylate cyclase (GGDEF)-like protein